ncbi:hypothetical protein HYS99_00580 [Candidatus Giovannonibacteria bacterium]|nr:hypothetical protein [Candidatus Giovannonibacteria bacterium]
MDDQKQKDILETYANLPADLQNALFAPQTTSAIREIGKKHELTLDKVGVLGDETGAVMMGLAPLNEFIKNLSIKLEVDRTKARSIAEDINAQIFKPVRESLKQVHHVVSTTEPTQGASKEIPPPTPPYKVGDNQFSPPLQGGAGEVITTKPEEKLEREVVPKSETKKIPPLPKEMIDGLKSKIPSFIGGSSDSPKTVTFEQSTVGGEIKKPEPPENLPVEIVSPPASLKSDFKSQKKSDFIPAGEPTIFAKKLPEEEPLVIKPMPNRFGMSAAEPSQTASLQSELEKELGGSIRRGTASPDIPRPPKKNDPYREPIE